MRRPATITWLLSCCSCFVFVVLACPAAAQTAAKASKTVDRVAVSDAWMLQLESEEQDKMRTRHWLMPTLFSASAIAWGIGTAVAIDEGSPNATRLALAGATAASVGFAVASLAITDRYVAESISRWAGLAELGMGAVVLFAAADERDSNAGDRPLFLRANGIMVLGLAAAGAIALLFFPPVYVSAHTAAYRALPYSDARVHLAERLLLDQETRERSAVLFAVGIEYAIAAMYASAAIFQAETTAGRNILAGSAAAWIAVGTTTLLLELLISKPSQYLKAGRLPPPRREQWH